MPLQYSDDGSRPVTWHVTWLPRPSGAGFSGMWRGFAIDMVRVFGIRLGAEIEMVSRWH